MILPQNNAPLSAIINQVFNSVCSVFDGYIAQKHFLENLNLKREKNYYISLFPYVWLDIFKKGTMVEILQ